MVITIMILEALIALLFKWMQDWISCDSKIYSSKVSNGTEVIIISPRINRFDVARFHW